MQCNLSLRSSLNIPSSCVSEKIEQIPNILPNQDELRNLWYPTDIIEPIPYLAPPKPDGLKCRACGHIVRRIQKIQKHCTDEYQWMNPGGRGRPPPDYHMSAYQSPWEEGVAYQRFFPSRAGSRWFQVNSPIRLQRDVHKKVHTDSFQSRVAPQELGPVLCSHLSEVVEREKKYWETMNQPRLSSKDMDSGSFATTNCFLGQGTQERYPDIISSSEAEQKISCILGALYIVVDRCENTIRRTSRFLLCWLNSTRLPHFHERPFSLVAEKSTE
ncbi:hypothetical protein QL093DRAFT_2595349 [Fusarium oxysporum]|nr:hypothetical protein QL093DRAFT_2595349 [Fusarium oxysporum]